MGMMHFLWGGSPFGFLFLLPLALVAVGALYWSISSRNGSGRTRALRGAALENQILQLAVKNHGVLTITEIAAETGLSLKDAEKAMTRMVDFSRVSMKVDEVGLVTYEFTEIVNTSANRRELPHQ